MNNNFISAEEFKKQSEKVQNTLRKWWEPQKFDLIYTIHGNSSIQGLTNSLIYYYRENHGIDYIRIGGTFPLLQMYQLINFIEDKVNKEILINTWEYKGGIAAVVTLERLDIHVKSYKGILDALWQVTIQIIEGE